ncbi:GNAT family N-acetyltransferase [Arachnia propionica]|uniref:N-acetyltransferase n=1 Tax=Arachnia propionica TaxID=1750 RepID=A0A3N4D1K3_9ACTN|nr:GNAT family N-acetyltransferase [Arachnia propionica]AFN46141.1 hypothetical protein HMPREF9154_1558 [Arachnia propionica F0230a]QCT37838.1 N-acetyltransferase [Arachnia propionica]QUC09807.1 N-acetyltransferase [Arachnia propionica]QUC15515.1 N-acetyltransferase [Arachnia propionica]RPA16733.1 N-acetyltransferase [Arachnia propionica]
MSKSKLMNNEAGSRFELLIDGRVATYIDYVDHGYALELTHTVTEPDFRGRGLAGELVDFALTRIEAEEKRVIPTCSFVAERVTKKPEFTHLVARFPHP